MKNMNKHQDERAFMQLGIQEFFATQDDESIDWEDGFGLTTTDRGSEMQALRVTKNISDDGYIHVHIPRSFVAKRVDLIILPAQEQPEVNKHHEVKEEDIEWDVDYETADASFGQTMHTFEMLDQECGTEDPSKWK